MLRDEGYQFMAAAFEVYNQLGYGMPEEVYQQSLEIELELRTSPLGRRTSWPSSISHGNSRRRTNPI